MMWKNNGSKIWEVREGIIGKILSILGSALPDGHVCLSITAIWGWP